MNDNFELMSQPQKDIFKEKTKKLRNKILELMGNESIGIDFKFNKIYEFGKRLQHKYPDYLDYLAYSILIGSTPIKEYRQFDFQGDDSVEKFIDSFEI